MVINNDKSEEQEEKKEDLDFNDLTLILQNLKKEYRNVYAYQAQETVFFYRSLTRKEYKELVECDLSNEEKEETLCEVCTLFPEKFDFTECDAGVPTTLAKTILKNSFLDTLEHRKSLTEFYRNEMFDLQNQVTCIINEAFPQHDIEEIEDWDLEKTAKYLSRAEWKLVNLRGAVINFDPDVTEEDPNIPKQAQQAEPQENKKADNKKEKMTPEKLEHLKEMQRKFPEIDWFNDSVLKEGVDGIEQAEKVDVVSPALRPIGQ